MKMPDLNLSSVHSEMQTGLEMNWQFYKCPQVELTQCLNVIHKANSRLHLLRQLKRAEVPRDDMLHFYISIIRPVLEYAVAVWHAGLTADLWSTWSHPKMRTSYNIWWLQFYYPILWIFHLYAGYFTIVCSQRWPGYAVLSYTSWSSQLPLSSYS